MIPSLSLRQKASSRFAEKEEEEEEAAAGGAAPQKTHIHSTYMSATGDNRTFPSLSFFSSFAAPKPPLHSKHYYHQLIEKIWEEEGRTESPFYVLVRDPCIVCVPIQES